MSIWEAYPINYREAEVRAILAAVRSGECVSVVGLSGAGKSNLMGFLQYRGSGESLSTVLVDGNRAHPRTAEGLFALAARALTETDSPPSSSALSALESAIASWMSRNRGVLCLLLDRFDALSEEERQQASGPLRALRDSFKYRLTYVIATRRPLDSTGELAELFYANTFWLGPLSPENARWSAGQYAARRGQSWDAGAIDQLVRISWGYPSLLRACCEAYANGAALDGESLRAHPTVQRRAQEFWADHPTPEDVRRSGLAGHPLLADGQMPEQASPSDLTASEQRLLVYLQNHPGEVCAKDDLIQAVWPEEKVSEGLRDDSLAQLIRRLRKKIGVERIQTLPGRGYRYVAQDMI